MKKLHFKIATLVACVLLYVSCTKTGPAGPAGTNGTNAVQTGNIEGLVFLYDANQNKILSPASLLAGTTLTLTNYSTGQTFTATTSTTGSYTLANVTTGTYSITASKTGYGSVIAYGFQFVGGGTIYKNFNLGQIPTANLVSVTTGTTSSSVTFTVTVPLATPAVNDYVITYMSIPGNSSVNSTAGNYVNTYLFSIISTTPNNVSTFSINTSTLYNYGFASGSTIYFASYIVSTVSNYQDPNTGLNVYTALSSTPVFTSAIVP